MPERGPSDLPALKAQHQLGPARNLARRRACLQPAVPLVEMAPIDLVPGRWRRPRRRRHWLSSRRMIRRILPRGDEEEAWVQLPPHDVRNATSPARPQGYRRGTPFRTRAECDPRVDQYDDAAFLPPPAALAKARVDSSLLEQVDVTPALPTPAPLRAPRERLGDHVDERAFVADALGLLLHPTASTAQPGCDSGSPRRRNSLAIRSRLTRKMPVEHDVSMKPRAP